MAGNTPPLAASVCFLLALSTGALALSSPFVPRSTPPVATRLPSRYHGQTQTPPNPYLVGTKPPPAELMTIYDPEAPVVNRSSVSGTYLMTVPEVAILGFNFTIGFESFLDKPISLKARIMERVYIRQDSFTTIRNDVEVVSTYGVFTKGSPGVLSLPIPDNYRTSTSHFWEVSCVSQSPDCPWKTFRGNYTSQTGSLSAISAVATIFVQTDKAIYKPGQLVHYRVFAVYPDLQMYDGNFTIQILDPNNNKIQYRKDVMGQNGVVEGSLGLADQPIFGDWVISVTTQTAARTDTHSKSFTVAEYQLPRFEVVVDMPSYALTSDNELHGTVKATYTFGQPVKGMVELHIMSATALPDSCGNEPRHMEQSFRIDGEAKFTVSVADINRVTRTYSGSTIKVTASVKEDLTDVTLKGSSTVTYHTSPYKIAILDNTPAVFKPGLPFRVFAKASMIDNTPIVGESGNTMSMYVTAHYVIPSTNSYLYGVSDFRGTYALPVQVADLPPSGVVKMDLDIPSNATQLDVTVVFKGLATTRTIRQMFSISDNYLQLTMLDKDLKSGQVARMEARATEPMTDLRYQILSRGMVYESKVINTQGQHVMTFDVPLTPMMAPTAHMMAYYVRPDLEIVPDSIAFNVEGIFENEVSVEMSTNMSEPHANLTVTVRADPDSVVNLLTVDQSVLLLKSGNDVTPEQVSSALQSYDRGQKPSDSTFALSLSRVNAKDTLNRAGIETYSDAALQMTSKPRPGLPRDPSIYGPPIFSRSQTTPTAYPPMYTTFLPGMVAGATLAPGMAFGGGAFWTTPLQPMGGMAGFMTTVPPIPNANELKDQPLKEVERVRNLFPETWLWVNTTVGANGSSEIKTTVPDTITSWITTAFATNAKTGLGITPSSTKLTVFRSFFVSLTMPSSVVRGEHVVIQASVFNYLPSDVSVLVSLPGSREYTSLVIADDGSETMSTGDVEKAVVVKSQGQTAVYFPIIPSAIGAVDLEVSARSTLAADAVRRQLIVEAEGVPTEFSVPVFINLGPNGTKSFTQTYPISMPDDVIDGSARSRVKVTGDILGPSVNGLENLLRLPTGCGEQNMIKLAPDLYIANYLTATGQMTAAMQARVKFLIETGYQRELTYQRRDGSFSAFGNKDGTGSTWLTAFVLRVFHEARPFVYVDDGVLQRALDWIISHQNQDGSFNEFGYIFDQEMNHFKDHSNGLTSFVLISLLENADVPATENQRNSWQWAINNATDYLKNHHQNIMPNDYLSLTLTCLALTKAGSPEADTLFNTMMSKSTTEHGMTFWKTPTTTTSRIDPYSRWRPTHVRARPIDIHVTSYALLVYSARGMLEEGMDVLHWLTRQRNPYGGFTSTQDTVVGLQAMTEFVQKAVPAGYDLHLDVRAQHSEARFDVTSSNALVLQARDFSAVPSEVTFNASGNGVAVAELDVFFNVESDLGEPAFDVSAVLLDDYLNSFKVMICTRWLLPGESGMVVQEVGIPSGFAPDMTSVGNVAGVKRTEQRGRFLDIYFEKITKNSLCYTVMFDRQSKVAHSQPSYIITQDYYEPSNRATVSYQSLSLKDADVCDVCRECCPHS